jgi:hypothetical protein
MGGSLSARERPSRLGPEKSLFMSTIEDVRAAEKRVQMISEALRKADALDPDHLGEELKKASDEYAKAVRELNPK